MKKIISLIALKIIYYQVCTYVNIFLDKKRCGSFGIDRRNFYLLSLTLYLDNTQGEIYVDFCTDHNYCEQKCSYLQNIWSKIVDPESGSQLAVLLPIVVLKFR